MLYVNNKTYSVEDLEQSEASAEINEKSNSAPGTPSSQNHHKTAEKTILTDINRNQKPPSFSTPAAIGAGKKQQPIRKDEEEKKKVETRSKVTRNTTGLRDQKYI
ncbi:hypothetical protein JTB14_036190 [Gonioctena quinquepunctata]|nr:hypothetical protein JTB14_036190 [Gonioctena quinquepunctata]